MHDLNLKGNVAVSTDEKTVTYNLTSDNNGFLIGKNGKTLQSFQTLAGQVVNQFSEKPMKIIVDVDSYRMKQIQRLEFLARKVAKEVIQTRIPAKLDPMNAYERRIIHQTLTDWAQIQTISEGVDPNRYLVIKYK
jgi:spoIIIJ-associated protein